MCFVDYSCLSHLDCNCDEIGRENNTCNWSNGACLFCKIGFEGDKCKECTANFAPASGIGKCTHCIEGYFGVGCDQGNNVQQIYFDTFKGHNSGRTVQ